MANADWIIVLIYLAVIVGIGLYAARKTKGTLESFFVSGRSLPWWLAGTSMLATSFSSDTPLHTTRMIREHGLGGAWFYWGGIFAGVCVAFFFARMWRRSGVVTDAELFELRYGGRGAATLRGAIALYRGLVLEMITLAWVTLGMTKIVSTIVALPETITIANVAVPADTMVVALLVALCMAYSVTSGLWGVVLTDLFEFALAMFGAVLLAIMAMIKVGGPSGLARGLAETGHPHALEILPSFTDNTLPALAIGVYLGVQWWSTPYVDGSGQRAQRFLACKDERQALLAGVWNMAVQWIIRSWPWYLAALASLVLYPTLVDHERAYPTMVVDLLPVGLRGVMVASFIAAFMSTFTGLLNLCASYLSNDVYKRFVRPKASERHHVFASRSITLFVALLAGSIALLLPSVLGAFRFKLELMAGLGLVSVLRWFWWRINAKAELATLVASSSTAVFLTLYPATSGEGAGPSALRVLIVVAVSALTTIAVSLATKAESEEKLLAFYERVRPPAIFWKPIAAKAAPSTDRGPINAHTVLELFTCMAFIFAAMIAVGKLALGDLQVGLALALIAGVAFWLLWRWVLRSEKTPRTNEADHVSEAHHRPRDLGDESVL